MKRTSFILSAGRYLISGTWIYLMGSALAFSAPVTSQQLPGSVLPGVLSERLSERPASSPVAPKTKNLSPEQTKQNFGAEANKIKFKLVKIILTGNKVYSTATIENLYKNNIGKEISVNALQDIVQNITNYYRNNGYILSRALLPPQKIQNGIVQIQIVEGFISQVRVVGSPWRATGILNVYGKKITESRPLQLSLLEHYLLMANNVPGAEVKSVLQPSKDTVGASDLDLVTNQKIFEGSIGYNNQGTRYIGPTQLNASLTANSMLMSGDSTRLTWTGTPARPRQMKFYDASYGALLGSNGLHVTLGKNYSLTRAGYTLQSAGIQGSATTYYAGFSYPLIWTQDTKLSIDGGINYLDSTTTSFGNLLYIDHLRTFSLGAYYSFPDKFKGQNIIDLTLKKGLPVAGATTDTTSRLTSRFGGTGNFIKVITSLSRQQAIYGRFSVLATARGQYSPVPLLASEQFSFGGSNMGRAYDPAEIIGDRGISGLVQLNANFYPAKYISTIQPYIFYDEGVIWNIKNIRGTNKKDSAASAGLGVNFAINTHISGGVYIAQPLTRVVDALDRLGRGRRPRAFFSINITS